jgi:hypothetical protein
VQKTQTRVDLYIYIYDGTAITIAQTMKDSLAETMKEIMFEKILKSQILLRVLVEELDFGIVNHCKLLL